ncbi:xanthine dehydrogenase family protein molybdopterin-binding subunit [Plastoroseomonas arctica]|uniref:Xanthine dehydrogenase family protein molybdopterin-binding subunit n=1 Tax=Plastoroseomonas arctica TaxID=1509237 RepID=A0AAF1JY36_9PROT|nr:xanthine dehydrogenase family protein molybdopterin-binding subunit [Plastoroseomonas arctica]MBR0653463.1 xanthine dehydrogenase family protein molybdopterin-binding subunit [Plastoroseomonas arctica]
MTSIQDAAQSLLKTAIGLVPARWLPGGSPDPLMQKHGLIGAPVSRLDGALKVRGKARFAAEVPMQGLTYAALLHSTVARGRIVALDISAAEAAPGVVFVMTYRNAPRMASPALMNTKPKAAGTSNLPVMQDAEIHWNGEPVAVLLADTQEQADHAVTLIRVTYETAPAITDFDAAKGSTRVPANILGEPPSIERGNAEATLVQAAFQVDCTYATPAHNHNAIELHAATLAWEGDKLILHDATQMVNNVAWTLSQIFGIKEEQVHVRSPYVGGGFGGKSLWNHQILAAAASRVSGRPVRIMLPREGVFRSVGGRTMTEQRVALGARSDGKLTALIHTGTAAMTPHNECPEQFSFPARHLYAAENIMIAQRVADMNIVANTFMRAPGESIGTFALECAMDELAEAMQIDPIELRRRNEPAKDPTSGNEFSSRHLTEAYGRGAEQFGWEKRSATPGARRDGEWLIGMGMATATYPYYRMPGGAARIRLTADGRATVSTAAHEMGMGTATVQTQHIAERLGLAMDQVVFEHGDTALPPGSMAGGSSQTASIAAAIIAAHDAFKAALLKLVGNDSPLAGLKPDAVEARDGGLCSSEEPDKHETYVSILRRAGREELVAEASAPPPLEAQEFSMHSYGAQFCEVRVSEITGEVRVSRFLGSFDCGRILNAKTAASQFRGGIIMGLGLALMEETHRDPRTGRIMNPSLAEYHVPVHMDVPKIDVIWTDIPDPHSPLGAHGIGEIGITGVGAAVANAVYNATGKRIRKLPISLDKLL